jgi:hypothetical protein
LDEVLGQYSYAVPLNQDALIFGAVVALIILLSIELLLAFVRVIIRKTLPSSPTPKAQ